MFRLPKRISWTVCVGLLFIVVLTCFRIIFYLQFKPAHTQFPLEAFVMGLRFDLRIVAAICLLSLLFSFIVYLNPFKKRGVLFWNIFFALVASVIIVFYVSDYFHYEYLQQRLHASVLGFAQDASISSKMIWQSYPVFKLSLLIIVFVALMVYVLNRLLIHFRNKPAQPVKRSGVLYFFFILLLGIGLWGTVSQFALRWSNAFSYDNAFSSQLALNPFQSFFSSLQFKNASYDIKKVRDSYAFMADYLGIPNKDSAHLNFERTVGASSPYHMPSNLNVVLVICESFSAYKSSMWGNPLNTTPFFKSMCDSGIFFNHCFTPSHSTARGVWATVTGLTDLIQPGTASRNFQLVDQHTLMNDLKGYEKFYFIGGSASWANIRGLLDNNIQDLHLIEQQDIPSKQINVWGVSDKNLFLDANKKLAAQQKPFMAVIQTADNHRPFTIPAEDEKEFPKISLPLDTLKKYGFTSNDELNAFRYTDFSYRKFIEAARKEKYFENTLFVFVGDHGVKGDAADLFPRAWTEQNLTMEHVPLLFYCPKFLPHELRTNPASQLDVLPSIYSLLPQRTWYTAMGKNLFDTTQNSGLRNTSTFIFIPHENSYGIVTNEFYYKKVIGASTHQFVSVRDNQIIPSNPYYDSIQTKLDKLTEGFYATNLYLLFHNRNRNHKN